MTDNIKVVFLDRDGVLNVDTGYVYRVEDLQFTPHVFEGLQALHSKGYSLVVVTNQSGIARAYYSENDVHILHSYMDKKFRKENIYIEKWYYCPHHPNGLEEEHKKSCLCRKPGIGMIQQAQSELSDIQMEQSFMVGDKPSDIDCGKQAGLRTVQIISDRYPRHPHADHYFHSLFDWAMSLPKK